MCTSEYLHGLRHLRIEVSSSVLLRPLCRRVEVILRNCLLLNGLLLRRLLRQDSSRLIFRTEEGLVTLNVRIVFRSVRLRVSRILNARYARRLSNAISAILIVLRRNRSSAIIAT